MTDGTSTTPDALYQAGEASAGLHVRAAKQERRDRVATQLSGRSASCWTARAPATDYPRLQQSLHADVLVVGGGIVGLTTALRLVEAGKSVIVLEARRIGAQVTGRSTAKVTTQHGLIYKHLIDTRGKALAQAYADANTAGARQISAWIENHRIACDYEPRDAYVFVEDAADVAMLEHEAEAARSVGLTAEVLERAPLSLPTAGALRFPDQAQFNPQAYVVGLAGAVSNAGGRIFEQSRAVLIDEASRWRAVTAHGNVHAEHLVVATNMTVKSPVGMSRRTQPRMHTAMAFRIDAAEAPEGMFISARQPTHSLRAGGDDKGDLLVALGPKFNTGQDGDVAARFIELEAWVRGIFPVGEVAWRWCNEDYDTPDRVAFVGEPDRDKAPGFFIATGFNAWGITNGTAAGILIADRIATGSSPWSALYDPARPSPKNFNQAGDSRSRVDNADAIPAGSGGIVTEDGEPLAVWRDAAGELHALSAKCTHKGCIVTWNNADRTWDCPCHGSMFEADGTVLHGPARKPLAPAELKRRSGRG
jgi:glycine/D-amino acid oxidase-like deaminating enzyme/nitrite reductase/ring-hydroxylating ferredoxin subunit